MKEYIEREAVIKYLEKYADGYSYIETPTESAIADIKAIPAADVVEVQDALAFSQTFNLDEYRGKEDQRDCDFVFGVLMRLGIVCLKMYDPTTRTMKLWVEKVDGGVNDDDN